MLAREPIIPGMEKPFKVSPSMTKLFAVKVHGHNCSFAMLHLLVIVAHEVFLMYAIILQTSIVFSLEEGPGVLFKALAVFALRQINLTKVFVFLLDFSSHFESYV